MLLGQAYFGLGRKLEGEAVRQRALRIIEKHLKLHPDAVGLFQVGTLGRSTWGRTAGRWILQPRCKTLGLLVHSDVAD
jgi:hypothetical protein